MKNLWRAALYGAAACTAVAAGAASLTITVSREPDAARAGETMGATMDTTIVVPFSDIDKLAPGLRMFHLVVRDARGRSLPLQVTNYQHDHKGASYDDLVFQYDFPAGQKRATFTLESVAQATPPETPCVYARVVSERHGDMAWENDRIAHRMYGFALNTPGAGAERLRGSGIDVWGKRVTYPIVDRWYAKGHDQFHQDEEGEGYDLYSVGGSRGAGGTGVWDGTKLWTSDNFAGAEVHANGPRRAAFTLTYAPWDAGAAGHVAETKRITVDCGRNFDAVESVFVLKNSAVVGIGLTGHPRAEGFPAGVLTKDPQGRWMSWWEENKDGGLGVAVILGSGETSAGYAYEAPAKLPGNGNHLLLVKAADGAQVRYFTGAGWTKSGQFADRAAWETFVRAYAAQVATPLTVTVSKP